VRPSIHHSQKNFSLKLPWNQPLTPGFDLGCAAGTSPSGGTRQCCEAAFSYSYKPGSFKFLSTPEIYNPHVKNTTQADF